MKNIYKILLILSFVSIAQPKWSPLTSILSNGNNQRFDDVFFINEDVGWAVNGFYAAVYKTIDGGATWDLQMSNTTMNTHYYFRNIEFIDENIGFIGTLNGVFFKTNNGGDSWTIVTNFPTNPVAICGLSAVGNSTVYGCGAYFSPAFIIKSSDSGETWDYIDMGSYATKLVEILFLNENVGYVSGSNANGGVVLKTTDSGVNWKEIYNTNIAGEYVWKLQVLQSNSDVIFGSVETVAPYSGKLLKSLDGGITWISKNFPDSEVQAVGFLSESHGWMGGHNTGFYETTDGGDTWTNTAVGSNLNRIFILNDNLAYASGTTIYKYNETLSNNQFIEQARIPLVASVTPNPINNNLNLTIQFLDNDHLLLELYEESGKFVKELKKDNIDDLLIRNYTFDFSYASGVYFLNLHTNTGRQIIKVIKQ